MNLKLISVIIVIIILIILIIVSCYYYKLKGGFYTSVYKYSEDENEHNNIKCTIDIITNVISAEIYELYESFLSSNDLNRYKSIDTNHSTEHIYNKYINMDADDYYNKICTFYSNINKEIKSKLLIILKLYIKFTKLITIELFKNKNKNYYFLETNPLFQKYDFHKLISMFYYTLLPLIEFITICVYKNIYNDYLPAIKIISYESSYNLVVQLQNDKILRLKYPMNKFNETNYIDNNESIISDNYTLHNILNDLFEKENFKEYLPHIYLSSLDYKFTKHYNHCLWYVEDNCTELDIEYFIYPKNDEIRFKKIKEYVIFIGSILKILHSHRYYYYDWKIFNIMRNKENTKFVLSDFDIADDTMHIVSTYNIFNFDDELYEECYITDTYTAFIDIINVHMCTFNNAYYDEFMDYYNEIDDDTYEYKNKYTSYEEYIEKISELINEDKNREYIKEYLKILIDDCGLNELNEIRKRII